MRKLIGICFSISVIYIGYSIIGAINVPEKIEDADISTFKKDKSAPLGVISYQSTKKEIKVAKIKKTVIKSRGPASIKPKEAPLNKRHGRLLTGHKSNIYKDHSVKIKFANKVNPRWKEKAAKVLLNLQDNDTSIVLKKEVGVIDISPNGTGRYLEKVLVSYIKGNRSKSSFHALVDSATGKVVRTWNHTRYEKKENFKLTPGILK